MSGMAPPGKLPPSSPGSTDFDPSMLKPGAGSFVMPGEERQPPLQEEPNGTPENPNDGPVDESQTVTGEQETEVQNFQEQVEEQRKAPGARGKKKQVETEEVETQPGDGEPTEVESLRAELEEQRKITEELLGLIGQQNGGQAPAPQQQNQQQINATPAEFQLSDEEVEQLFSGDKETGKVKFKEVLNKKLNNIYSNVVQEVSQRVQSTMTQYDSRRQNAAVMINKFFGDNPDLKEVPEIVDLAAAEIMKANPVLARTRPEALLPMIARKARTQAADLKRRLTATRSRPAGKGQPDLGAPRSSPTPRKLKPVEEAPTNRGLQSVLDYVKGRQTQKPQ